MLDESVKAVLVETVRKKELITYSRLAERVNGAVGRRVVPERGKGLVGVLTPVLHRLCASSVREGKPMIGAVVVSSRTGMPSEGFFRFASQLYNITFRDENDKLKFWKGELEKLYRGNGY
ncbi:MAG: hypothetical protein GXN94_00365 [Aquificae bacterium]|nr:hypothetical protein [Aquificota bacterium]